MERPVITAREMAGGDIGEPETAGSGQPRDTCQPIGTRPRRHANAPYRADWSGVYELSKKLHREANSTALRGTPILIGPPQRGQLQVRVSETAGAQGSRGWGVGGARG